MANPKPTSNLGSVLAAVASGASVFVLIAALVGLVAREVGPVAVLVAAQAAAAAAIFLPAVLSKVNDRETLSVYRAMSAR